MSTNVTPSWSALKRKDLRRVRRYAVDGTLRISWLGVTGSLMMLNHARVLNICEDGLVHYCSQQRGYPAIPLEKYTIEDIRREYLTEKSCAAHCTVSCVHQVSIFDSWRAPQQPTPAHAGELVQIR